MEDDERFKHLASDPRFKRLRKKQRKVEIDERFQHMFTDERFTLKYSKDKRGQNLNKSTGEDLKKYYFLKEDSPADHEEETTVEKEHVVAEKQQVSCGEEESDGEDDVSNASTVLDDEEQQTSDDESVSNESELSSSSDEAASDEEGPDDIDTIKYDWQPLDHDADVAESTTKRLAIQNLDWDRVNSKDLYILTNSIRPPMKVTIYVSEFGKERLRRERLEGPQEIVEMSNDDAEEEEYKMLKSRMEDLENPKPKALRVNEYEDADDELDPKNEEIRERIRRYQLSRLKYYYAVVEFDSVESAELAYKELDGMEFEGTSLELDLRFIPDDVDFDEEDMKEECNKLPDLITYKAPQFISSALQQTTVKFTWDETDVRRQEKLHKAYTKEELEKDDLDAYLASESDSDEQSHEDGSENLDDSVSVVTANSEVRLNKYKLLLKSLEEEENRKKKTNVDVEWDNFDESGSEEGDKDEVGEGEESDEVENGAEALSDSYANDQESESSDNSLKAVHERPSRGRKKDRRKEKKELKKNKKGEKRSNKAEVDENVNEELDLLVMDVEDKRRDEFKFNPEDDRFKAVYDSAPYNIDPSHPNFKRTQAFDLMAEKKREKRRKIRS